MIFTQKLLVNTTKKDKKSASDTMNEMFTIC